MKNQIIDTAKGDLFINSIKIGPETSEEYLFQQFPKKIQVQEQRLGWDIYKISDIQINEVNLSVIIHFYYTKLQFIDLYLQYVNKPKSWDEWTEELELAKNKKNEDWLDDQIGKRRTFDWGEINAMFDRKGGYSSIVIKYKK